MWLWFICFLTFPPLSPVLGLPNQVEELCPDIPELEVLMKEIHDLAESGARYTEMPHVIEITLPMLCNYLPRWWERGLENFPDMDGQICTSVTSEHLNQLLGSIMKIVVNNLGIDEASWMKRLAGQWAEVSQIPRRFSQLLNEFLITKAVYYKQYFHIWYDSYSL